MWNYYVEDELIDYFIKNEKKANSILLNSRNINKLNELNFNRRQANLNNIFDKKFCDEIIKKWQEYDYDKCFNELKKLIDDIYHKCDIGDLIELNHIMSCILNNLGKSNQIEGRVYYARVIREYLPIQHIPTSEIIERDSLLENYRKTEALFGDIVLVSFVSDSNSFYVYTSCSEGWINGFETIEFIDIKDAIEATKNKKNLLFNKKNISCVCKESLGKKYYWGTIFDCSGFVRYIFGRFGIILPSNTTNQKEIECLKYNLSGLDYVEKSKIFNEISLGALIYMKGHVSMYLGKIDSKYYVVGAVGSVINPESMKYVTIDKICITTMDTLRKNGNSWFEDSDMVLIPWMVNKN